MKNVISWFEIPTVDLERATKFYETIFNIKMNPLETPQIRMRMFPIDDPMTGIGGALASAPGFYQPSPTDGPLIYLNANPDVQRVLDKVEAAGGAAQCPVAGVDAM